MKTIVISAVNLVEAGTLSILKDCLSFLSAFADNNEYRIVAIVHNRNLVDYPNIEYIENTWPKRRWINRLWFEYISMRAISKRIGPVYLWFSLHDTSPSVVAERQAVYCHNAFPFYRWKRHDLLFAPKIVLFALFSKFIYLPNIHSNTYLVVQQDWFRNALHQLFRVEKRKIIVAPPKPVLKQSLLAHGPPQENYSFIFAGSPNSHKNFEVICKAAAILEKEGFKKYKVHITLKGDENKYAKWIYNKWGSLKTVDFMGFVSREILQHYYTNSNCLIYPSKIESWGLPISEFAHFAKPMLLADLPYAYDTASGSPLVSFFNPEDPYELAKQMKYLIQGDHSFLKKLENRSISAPVAANWEEIFKILLH